MNEVGSWLLVLALAVGLVVWLAQPQQERWSPAGGRISRLVGGWAWSGEPPASFVALRRMFAALFVAFFLLLGSIAFWAPRQPSPSHPGAFRMREGKIVYLPLWLNQVIVGSVVLGGGLVLAMGVVGWRNRHRLERYQSGGTTGPE